MITAKINSFHKWAKILLIIFGLGSWVYRVLLYVDSCSGEKTEKDDIALLSAIICIVFPLLMIVLLIADLVSMIRENKFSSILC